MALDSMKEIFERSARENIPFWEIVLQYDMEERQVSRQASMAKMLSTWQAIQDAADSYTGTQRSVSGLVGGDGLKMRLYARRGESIGGEFMDEVIVQAISMAESNACMRRIVAAPTAGSCGVVPAVLLPLARAGQADEEAVCDALYVAAGFGQVIAARATLAGAEGGCQAEVGAASAMAAAALCNLKGGTPEQCAAAAAMASIRCNADLFMLSGVCDYNFPEKMVGRMPLFKRGPNLRVCPEAVRRDVPAEARGPSWGACWHFARCTACKGP